MATTEEGRDWARGNKMGRNRPEEPGRRKDEPRLYDHNSRAKGWLISH